MSVRDCTRVNIPVTRDRLLFRARASFTSGTIRSRGRDSVVALSGAFPGEVRRRSFHTSRYMRYYTVRGTGTAVPLVSEVSY